LQDWVAEALVAGANRATIRRIVLQCTGCYPSEGLLKRVCRTLDEAAKAFKERLLRDRYEYLFLDAAWVKDIVGLQAGRVCILTAVGVTPAGRKEILGFERVGLECAQAWRGFLTRLKERGLDVSALRLVVSDEHKGIRAAVEEVLGDVAHQYCWAHRMRNVRDAMGRDGRKAHQKALVDALRRVYLAPHRRGALDAFRAFKAAWAPLHPTIVASVEEDLGHLLAFYGCPELHWEYIRTSNPIERLFVELRRARFGAGAFANPVSCDRVVANVYIRMNKDWADADIWFVRHRRRQKLNARAAATLAEASRDASSA
jgi:transposase-like protein